MNSPIPDNTTETPVIEFKNVSLSFDGVPALKCVSFKLKRGQVIIISGASRSGKTVLLHLAIGLLQPDEGEVLINGRDLRSLQETELLQLRGTSMGIVFQEDTLFTGLTVYDNTAFRLSEHEMPEEDIDVLVREILHFVGLDKDMEKIPEELSIGMRRRLEIARALVGWPSIMLFDEPTSGLDPINSRQILDLVIRARDIHGISSLHVTKEIHEIPYLSHHCAEEDKNGTVKVIASDAPKAADIKVMVLESGEIAFFGTPAEFQKSSIAAVSQLTHPDADIPYQESLVLDPWSRKLSDDGKML
jgi:phospholipid/cholesterol/gamma-HCH transport system ATP-binding protein